MPPRRTPPLWLMGLTNATFGLVSGFIVLPLPQMLAAEGISEARIAAISAACFSPGFWVFLLGPILDVRFSRRFYATLFALLAGLGLTSAVLLRGHLLFLEANLMLAYAAAVLSSNALGGWLSSILPQTDDPAHDNRASASLGAWTQVGLFLGNGAMAVLAAEGLAAQRHGRIPLTAVAIALGLLVMLPAIVFPFMPLPEDLAPDGKLIHERFSDLFRDVAHLLRRRDVLLTLALFLLPTGSFALTNILGGVASDFHASDAFVSRIGGAVLSLVGAASCLLLPILSRWVRALPLYLLIGTVGSLFTLALLLTPHSPTVFAIAFLGENVVQAMSFTAAVAICFTTIGHNNPLAATQFSLLTSSTVLPILYMGVLDGRIYTGFHALHGLHSMYLVDGGLSLIACAVMALTLRCFSHPAASPQASSVANAREPRS
jgi:PAT family beta-lactamase induction signal transducer AmpG